MNLAVIPARGGSKRIPQKNIREFHGQPMIFYPIKAALDSGCFEKVIVSTDSNEIAEISKKLGAEVPFIRPQELSDDFATTQQVVRHAIEALDKKFNCVCCLYATAPFVRVEDITTGLHMLQQDKEADFVFTVCEFEYPIQRALSLKKNGRIEIADKNMLNTRSQDLETMYHDAGQFYWGTQDAFLQKNSVLQANSLPIILPTYRVQDIDTEEDWLRAEKLFSLL